jgi:hypothetical protein
MPGAGLAPKDFEDAHSAPQKSPHFACRERDSNPHEVTPRGF